jgi:hypothetical protein
MQPIVIHLKAKHQAKLCLFLALRIHAAPCRSTVSRLELDNQSLTSLGIVVSGLPGSRYFNPLEKYEISVWHPF